MKRNVEKQNFDAYLEEAKSWETDKLKELVKSRTVAWRVASASGAVAFAAVLAVAALTPLKETEPYVLRVDSATGIVDVVRALKEGKDNYEEVVNKYFTNLYVRYREGYTKELAEEYYGNVGIMSIGLEQQKYYEWFNPKNPQSPINIYGPYAKVKVKIKSTSFIKPNVALVRYTKEIERGLDKPQVSHWAATIIFKYSGAHMKESDRGTNPLGFQVVEYRNDPDAQADATTPLKPEEAPAIAAPNADVTVFPGQQTPAAPGAAAPAPAVPALAVPVTQQ